MTPTPELLAMQQIHAVCLGHVEALTDALQDMQTRALNPEEYANLSKADRRLVDQFAYRYTRLQDDLGARLIPAVLNALGEDVRSMSAVDRFGRLEQLGWLPSADQWLALRQVRNQFAHEYPDSSVERFERLQMATEAARQLLSIVELFNQKIQAI
ncbi:hypothetical protein DIC66_16020 [Rhodoferax lacus]|uniref:Toxin-antitoxin antitoxin component n=1 Tax=Rhodoferax lacus TaxID=2184758 RepID=A0A3E1RA73_9BURK|nr:hypothetical protein [Rhodoferax lacus]RFO95932.1 hypothetical protein DIC66_16020 [Rhodoferax lacus]